MLRRKSSCVNAFEATTVTCSRQPPGRVDGGRLSQEADQADAAAGASEVDRGLQQLRDAGTLDDDVSADAPCSVLDGTPPPRPVPRVGRRRARWPADAAPVMVRRPSSAPAPAARANCSANSPIGPAPCTTTVSPAVIRLRRTPWKATVAGSTWAASSSLRSGWARMTRVAGHRDASREPAVGRRERSRPRATATPYGSTRRVARSTLRAASARGRDRDDDAIAGARSRPRRLRYPRMCRPTRGRRRPGCAGVRSGTTRCPSRRFRTADVDR